MIAKKRVGIYQFGAYGYNFGDRLLGEVVHRFLTTKLDVELEPKVVVAALSRDVFLRYTSLDPQNVVSQGGFNLRRLLRLWMTPFTIRKSDAVIAGGGGILQDQFGFILPLQTLFILALAKALGKKAIICGVGYGPLKLPAVVSFARAVLPLCDLVSIRSQEDYEVFEKQIPNHQPGTFQTSDFAFSLEKEALIHAPVDPSSVVIILRRWKDVCPTSILLLLKEYVSMGRKVSLVAYEMDDLELYHEILKGVDELRDKISVTFAKTIEEASSTISAAGLVISMRYHGCILSLMLEKPLYFVKCEYKVSTLAQKFSLENALLSPSDLNSGNEKLFSHPFASSKPQYEERLRYGMAVVKADMSTEAARISAVLKADRMPPFDIRIKALLLALAIIIVGSIMSMKGVLMKALKPKDRKKIINE